MNKFQLLYLGFFILKIIFKFKVIRDDISKNNLSDEYKNQVDLAYKRALRNDLFAKKDLEDIVYNTPDHTPDLFEFHKETSNY